MPASGESENGSSDWGRLIKKLKALPETSMRREVLAEQLLDMAPKQVLSLFVEVVEGAARRNPTYLIALDTVHETILMGQEQGPLYELFAEVYRLAREADNQGVARLLMIARPSRGPLEPDDVPLDPEYSRLTLGERKFMARGHDRIRLDRLLFDPEPSVIRNLLNNPHITEQDVIRLAARRPIPAAVIKQIQESRWGERYRVRLALVCNPYTPTELSVKLTGFLLKKELVMVSGDGNLHLLVREEAQRLLEKRGKRRKKKKPKKD
jgi:hypothetical protein